MPGITQQELDAALEKYRRKTLFVKLKKQIRAIEQGSKGLHFNIVGAAQAQLAFFQEKIRRLLDGLGVYVDLRHQYLAYAQALDKTQKELAFLVDLIREHQILRDRFGRRGLDPLVLDAIDAMVIFRTKDR